MTPTQFCQLVEARLGWESPDKPSHIRYRAEAGKVMRKIKSNPHLYTWDNLRLAVELCAREKKSRTPIGVFAHVERALDLALDPEVDIEEEIRKAIAHEIAIGDPDGWATRFPRCVGKYREVALQEWKASR